MALYLTKYSPIDFDKYLYHLRYLGYVYYDINSLRYESKIMKRQVDTMKYLVTLNMSQGSGGAIHTFSRYNIENFLIKYRNVPESMLWNKKTNSISIDQKHLSRVYEKGFAQEFISLYSDFTSLRSKSGLLASAVESCSPTDVVSYNGETLGKVTHNIKTTANLRTYYNDFNHQQLSKNALVAMKAPKGYTLVKGDFAQSDLKIAYNMTLKDRTNIDIMYKYPDSYEGMARVVEGSTFDREMFLEERQLYKANTLGPVYGALSAPTREASRIVNNMREYLSTLPVYNEFKTRIKKRVETGLPVTVKSYFGNSVLIDNLKDPKGILDAALNAPVQTGTSEIVIACANVIMDKFAEYGITEENGGIYLYLNRHDELIFMINNDYVNYSYIFQECEDILVDDWMPLKIEFSYSDNYAIPNEQLDSLFKSYYKDLPPININSLIEKAKSSEYFIPCDDTLRLCVGVETRGERSVVAFYNMDSEKYTFNEIASNSPDEILKGISLIIGGKKKELLSRDITSVLVYTDLVLSDSSVMAGIPIVFKTGVDDSSYRKSKYAAREKFDEMLASEV